MTFLASVIDTSVDHGAVGQIFEHAKKEEVFKVFSQEWLGVLSKVRFVEQNHVAVVGLVAPFSDVIVLFVIVMEIWTLFL